MTVKFYPWITDNVFSVGYHLDEHGQLCSVGVSLWKWGVFLLLNGSCYCRATSEHRTNASWC